MQTDEPEKILSQTMASSNETSIDDGPINSDSSTPKPEPETEHTLTGWDGPDDSGNPRNWSFGARVYGVFVPAWYAFAV